MQEFPTPPTASTGRAPSYRQGLARALAVALALATVTGAPSPAEAAPSRAVARAKVTIDVSAIEVSLGSVRVDGTAAPFASVALTHRRAADGSTARFETKAIEDGRWTIILLTSGGLESGDFRFLDPGDRVTIEIDGSGDPIVVTLPSISVESDPDNDRVSGSVPPGYTAALEIIDTWPGTGATTTKPAAVGADGRFGVNTAPTLDLLPRHAGRLVVARPDGLRYLVNWSYPRISIDTSTGAVSLVGHTHLPFDVTFALPNGEAYLRSAGRVAEHRSGGQVVAGATLNDPRTAAGRALSVREGDRVTAQFGALALDLTVPRFAVTADPIGRTVIGEAPAGADVAIEWFSSMLPVAPAPAPWQAATKADPSGRFRHAVAAAQRLGGGDKLVARLTSGRIQSVTFGYAAHLRVDLDSGRVSGAFLPNTASVVRWSRGGRTLGEAAARAGGDGLLGAVALDVAGGESVAAGDELTLRAVSAAAPVARVVVPAFSAAVTGAAGPLTGMAEPGAGRSLYAWQPSVVLALEHPSFGAGSGTWLTAAQWKPDGAFEAPYWPRGAPSAGTPADPASAPWQPTVFALLQMPDGGVLVRRGAAPTLSLSLGARRMCGLANPRAAIAVDRTRGDGTVDHWTTAADGDGRWSVEADAAAPPESGETWRGIAGGTSFAWTVQQASWSVDWPAKMLHLRLAPDQAAGIQTPVDNDCWGRPLPVDGGTGIRQALAAGADGTASVNWRRFLDIDPRLWEKGLQVALYAPSEHRLVMNLFPLQIEARLGTPAVIVRASGNAAVTAADLAPDGGAIGDASATADDVGWAALALADAGGAPAAVESGTRLVVRSAGEEVSLAVPPLDFDLTRAQGAAGVAPPGSTVQVRMLAAGKGIPFAIEATANAQGVWRISPRALDVRSGFDWLDVTSLEARLRVDDRHAFVRTVALDPVPRRYRTWLPVTWLRRR